jgi:DNA-binding NarL/FixJ family response regulator
MTNRFERGAGRGGAPLTDSEQAVIDLLGAGLCPKQIAQRRGTATATVRTQIKQAKRKLGARTLGELVAIGCRPD